jgi:hypothetical protein
MVVERSINLKIEDAKASILKEMVSAKLPATILRLILIEIKQIIDNETSEIIKKEQVDYQEQVTKTMAEK